MRYEGKIFRPPSEAASLILQATIGCSYNRCAFCAMYREKRFRIRSLEEIGEDIATARKEIGSGVRRVFLADGDALVMRTERLLAVIELLEKAFPDLQRVSAYATPQSLLIKKPEELELLRSKKLFMLYLGVESGSDKVLEKLRKGVTRSQMIEAGRKAVEAGMKLSTMIILGAGGPDSSLEHARDSASALNAIGPRFISTLTLMVVPATPLYDEIVAGRFTPPTPGQTIRELKEFIASLEVRGAVFRANHVSNLVSPAGTLPKDKERMVRELDTVLAGPIPEDFGPRGF